MPVDETIAKAWAKLTNTTVVEVFPNTGALYAEIDGALRYVPDPATQPWEWVKAFVASGYSVTISPDEGICIEKIPEEDGQWWEADTLEAAIRAWADAGKEAGR